QLVNTLEARSWIAMGCLREPSVEVARHRGQARWNRRRAHTDVEQQLTEGFSVERPNAGEALARDDAQGPQIGAMIDFALSFGLLGAHIIRGSHRDPGASSRGSEAWRDLGDAKVEHLDELVIAFVDEENIFGLQVAVNDAGVVCATHGASHLLHDLDQLLGGESTDTTQPSGEIFPAEQLHHQIRRGSLE